MMNARALSLISFLLCNFMLIGMEESHVQTIRVHTLDELKNASEKLACDIDALEQGVQHKVEIDPSVFIEYAQQQKELAKLSAKRLKKALQLLEPEKYENLSKLLQEKVQKSTSMRRIYRSEFISEDQEIDTDLTAALLQVFSERIQDKYETKKGRVLDLGSLLKRDRSLGVIATLVAIAGTAWGTYCGTSSDV